MENEENTIRKVHIKEIELFNGAVDIKETLVDRGLEDVLVVGIARGGLNLAQMLSYGLNCPVETISIQLRDCKTENDPEELYHKIFDYFSTLIEECTYKNIIFTDDLIDSGDTIDLIKTVFNDVVKVYKDETNLNIHFAVSFMDKKYLQKIREETFADQDLRVSYYYGDLKPEGWLVFPWDII